MATVKIDGLRSVEATISEEGILIHRMNEAIAIIVDKASLNYS